MRGTVLTVSLYALSLALSACDPSDPCDPGYYADHGACFRLNQHLDAGGDVDDIDDADAGETYGQAPFDADDFGKTCSSFDDCSGSAPVCGAPMFPLCTAINCLEGAAQCPSDWQCLDVTALSNDPGVRSICLKL